MSDDTTQTTENNSTDVSTDGGSSAGATTADYLDTEINLFRPATPFMRDHLKVVWATFLAWVVIVFGPVTVAALAPEAADAHRIAGTPTLFMVTAIGTPLGALVLSAVYAYQRDRLDEKYGIEHGASGPAGGADPAEEPAEPAADGGEPR